jgi:hypothetical protein
MVGLEFELSFMLAKQALHCLSHTSNPFCFGYFGDGVCRTYFLPRLALNLDPSNLCLSSS